MNEKITVSKAFEHGDRVGHRIDVLTHENGWTGVYHFTTHGLTPAQIAAKQDAVRAHHAKKAARLDEFAATKRDITAAGERFTVTDLTLLERGTDVVLLARLRHNEGDRIDIEEHYRSIDDVPASADLNAKIRNAAIDYVNRSRVAKNSEKSVRSVLGLEA